MNDLPAHHDASQNEPSGTDYAKQFFDILRAKGPTLDKVGKSFVIVGAGRSEDSGSNPQHTASVSPPPQKDESVMSDEDYDEPISGSRRLQQLRAEISKEFSAKRDESL